MRNPLRAAFGLAVAAGCLVGLTVSFSPSADATRNASGTFSLPAGNPVVSGQTISSTTHNNTMSDVATEMTDSLSRSGKGAMLAPLQLSNGTVALPSLTFGTDTDTGIYRVGANDIAITVGGTKALECTATTATIPVGLVVTQDTAATAGIVTTGNTSGAGITATGGTSGNGGTFLGVGGGYGVFATGGNTNGFGGQFTGVAAGYGVVGAGGATNGIGVQGAGGGAGAGGTFSNGTAATGGTRQDALVVSNGDIDLSGTANPTSTTSISERLTPMNLPKAWADVTTDGAGGITVNAGFNISACSITAGSACFTASETCIKCDFGADMAGTNYAVVSMIGRGTGGALTIPVEDSALRAAGSVYIGITNTTTGAYLSPGTTACRVQFVAFGAQ